MHKKENIADILDEALDQLRSGASFDAVLFNFPDHKTELAPLLSTLQMGLKIPVKDVPSPARQRKYLAAHPMHSFWERYLSFSKFALMPLGLFLALTTIFTASANPGQRTMYSLKRAVQRAPLALITNPELRAAKEVELSEKNLNETEAYINSENNSKEINPNVIADLTKQTSETIASVKNVATANAISGKSNDLLNKLVIIAEKQDKLVNAVNPGEGKLSSTMALEESKTESSKTVAEVKKLLATVNEQTMASFPASQESEAKDKPKVTEKAKTEKDKTTPSSTSPSLSTDPETKETEEASQETTNTTEVVGTFILEYPTANPENSTK